MAFRSDVTTLIEIPNVGPATIRYLNTVGVFRPIELIGQDPYSMFRELCQSAGKEFDPCLLDVFISAVKFMEGAQEKEWWHYTAERMEYLSHQKSEK